MLSDIEFAGLNRRTGAAIGRVIRTLGSLALFLACTLGAFPSPALGGEQEEKAAIERVLAGTATVLDISKSYSRQVWEYAKTGGDEPREPQVGRCKDVNERTRAGSWLQELLEVGIPNCGEYAVLTTYLLKCKAKANDGLFGSITDTALQPGDHLLTTALSADGDRAYLVDAWAGTYRLTTPNALEDDANCTGTCLYAQLFLGGQVPDNAKQQFVYPQSRVRNPGPFFRHIRTWGCSGYEVLGAKYEFLDANERHHIGLM